MNVTRNDLKNILKNYHKKIKELLNNKIDKETGKGLSTNDYTTVDKNKLDGATNSNTANKIVMRDSSGNFSAGTISASLNGNANTANKLSTARTISVNGDVTGSVSFDGSSNASISTTLSNLSSNKIVSMTGYSKASSVSSIVTTDSLNTAIGKLEKALDGKQASGSYATSSHTHNYAGSSSAGGSANSVANPLTISLNGTSQGTYDGSSGKNINITPSSIGAAIENHNHDNSYANKNLRLNTYTRFNVDGDADKYYPVVISDGGVCFGMCRIEISRQFNWTAPDTWNNSTHKGGLTLSIMWNGDNYWGGNGGSNCYKVESFVETYSYMVAGLAIGTAGLVVWLRGGGALYQIESDYGIATTVKVYLNDYTDGANVKFPVRTDRSKLESEVNTKYANRMGKLYDNGSRVYSSNNKPSPSDIGALPSTGITWNNLKGL